MDIDIAKGILDDQNDTLKLYEKYSGRGMYGKETAGVVGSEKEFMVAVAYYAARLGREGKDEEDLIDALLNLHTDNMGRSDMIFY